MNARAELREQLQPLIKMALMRRCAALRVVTVADTTTASGHTQPRHHRALAGGGRRRLEQDPTRRQTRPPTPRRVRNRCHQYCREMLIVAGDNPERVKSEPAFAMLCGVAPISASSGLTTRHRLNPGGHRHANAAHVEIDTVNCVDWYTHERPHEAIDDP